MPPPVPDKFKDEPQFTLWRDIARLQEDYQGDNASFIAVLSDVKSRLEEWRVCPVGQCFLREGHEGGHQFPGAQSEYTQIVERLGKVQDAETQAHIVELIRGGFAPFDLDSLGTVKDDGGGKVIEESRIE